MSNSALVDYTKISPNRTSPRKNKIDTITIHCVVGQCSVETLGAIFAPSSRQASSNYGIGYDGRFGMYCEEKDRSWCSSSAANDNRAITIEVASDATEPYAVNDEAYAALPPQRDQETCLEYKQEYPRKSFERVQYDSSQRLREQILPRHLPV